MPVKSQATPPTGVRWPLLYETIHDAKTAHMILKSKADDEGYTNDDGFTRTSPEWLAAERWQATPGLAIGLYPVWKYVTGKWGYVVWTLREMPVFGIPVQAPDFLKGESHHGTSTSE